MIARKCRLCLGEEGDGVCDPSVVLAAAEHPKLPPAGGINIGSGEAGPTDEVHVNLSRPVWEPGGVPNRAS